MPEPSRDLRAQQASEREDQMRDRFGLEAGGEGRPGVDALLHLDDAVVPFEVKSSDTNNVSTARDVGREHIAKWRQRHWLFGFYERGSRNPPVARCYIYASPRQLEPWIAEQEHYVLPDWDLVRLLPTFADRQLLNEVVGDKELYTLNDAKALLKQQRLEAGEHMTRAMRTVLEDAGLDEPRRMTASVYEALMDHRRGFSRQGLRALITRLSEPPDDPAVIAALGDRDCYPVLAVESFLRGRRLMSAGKLWKADIHAAADVLEGYSPARMLILLHERARYLLDRGATRNNPHIPERRLEELVPTTQIISGEVGRRAHWLEELVGHELTQIANAMDAATA